jgi:plastocyanin
MRIRNLTAAGLLGALLLPAATDAATKPVFRGPPPKGELKGVKGPAFDSSFYPDRVTIAKGDKIKLTTLGFGDTIFLPKGTKAPAFAVPNPDAPVSGAKDAAGNDMWFNGRPAFAPNPAAIMPQDGNVIDGTKVVGNGLALDGPPKPWVVKFPKAGTFVLRSALQPGVKLTVKVSKNARSAKKADAARTKRQLRANTKLANRLLKYKGPQGNVVRAGNDQKGVATIAFFPAKKTVKVGDTVTFTMSEHSIETHNVAFGPKAYLDEHAKRFFGPVFEPFVTFRSEAPGSAIVLRRRQPRQRLRQHGRARRQRGDAAAVLGQGHVHQGRHVRVLLRRARQRHDRRDRRRVDRCAGSCSRSPSPRSRRRPRLRPGSPPRSTSGRVTTPRRS